MLLQMDRYDPATLTLLAFYFTILVMLSFYGSHRYTMVYLYRKYARGKPDPEPKRRWGPDELPAVTVQLPLYNERYVAARLIDAVCALDYPGDRLEIQVLDDSTDDTTSIAQEIVDRWARRGPRHRAASTATDRTGYKAGALEGRHRGRARGVRRRLRRRLHPRTRLLAPTVHHFTDPTVGMVQARWDAPEPRLLAAHPHAGDPPRRAFRHRAHRPQPLRATSSTSTARRASGVGRRSTTPAAGSTTRSPKTWICPTGPSSRGGASCSCATSTAPSEIPVEMNAFKAPAAPLGEGLDADGALKLMGRIMRAISPPISSSRRSTT